LKSRRQVPLLYLRQHPWLQLERESPLSRYLAKSISKEPSSGYKNIRLCSPAATLCFSSRRVFLDDLTGKSECGYLNECFLQNMQTKLIRGFGVYFRRPKREDERFFTPAGDFQIQIRTTCVDLFSNFLIINEINDLFALTGWAFAIWGPIFTGEMGMAICALISKGLAEVFCNRLVMYTPVSRILCFASVQSVWVWANTCVHAHVHECIH
jgi:hypothetical protein